jgi:hypothetical protein
VLASASETAKTRLTLNAIGKPYRLQRLVEVAR